MVAFPHTMAGLLQQLIKTAGQKSLLDQGDSGAALAFRLVREMPYRRASDRQPGTIIREWRGTCSGKHYLLGALLGELGIETQLMACTTHVAAGPAKLPAELGEILREGPVPDVHNYLRLPWIVDATWPLEAAAYGLPVNPEWTPGQDMLLPCTPILEFQVPTAIPAQEFKDALLQEHFTEVELDRRDRFFSRLAGP